MTLSTWPWWIPWHGLVGGGLLTTDDYLSNKVYSLSDSLQIERLLLRRETERVPRNGTQMNLSFMDETIGFYISTRLGIPTFIPSTFSRTPRNAN
jgi:hypothetical protein